jgi:hypothetical protein
MVLGPKGPSIEIYWKPQMARWQLPAPFQAWVTVQQQEPMAVRCCFGNCRVIYSCVGLSKNEGHYSEMIQNGNVWFPYFSISFPQGKWGYTMGFEGYLFPKLTDCSRSWDLGEHPEPISIPVLKVDNPHTDHLRKQKDIIQRSTSPVFLDTISSKTLATIGLRFLGLQIDSPNVLPENNCWSRGDVMHCRHLNL